MKEYPILFSGEMVNAILSGRKAQTRRVVKHQPEFGAYVSIEGFESICVVHEDWAGNAISVQACPYAHKIGDHLWVRETWRAVELDNGNDGILYKADNHFKSIENSQAAADLWCDAYADRKHGNKWRPSIFMPRWASRILLEVTDVRVQRIQDVTGHDVIAEGVSFPDGNGISAADVMKRWEPFQALWNQINAERGYSWESNPWVWCISFKVVRP